MKHIKYIKLSTMVLFLAAVSMIAGASPGEGLHKIWKMKSTGSTALHSWEYEKARKAMDEMFVVAAEDGSSVALREAHKFRADYCFYEGDYACVNEAMGEALSLGLERDPDDLYERSAALVEAWAGSTVAHSEHFRLRYVEGRDEVLVGPALKALEAAHSVLTKDFDIDTGDPILVEVYPTVKSFSISTGLTDEDLEKSGTIAVCKYRRLMINTPRNLARGYSYLDTLSHELVHFVVYQRYGRAIPIWLHEALAKYQEDRYKGSKGGDLSPAQKSLLASALRQGELISFDRMSPSFAYLETPRQGQLAFAEVSTALGYMVDKGGWDLVFDVCDELAKGRDYRQAIKNAMGVDFDTFWGNWVSYAKGLGYEEIQGIEITVYEIRKGDENFEQVDEDVKEEELAEEGHWKYVRLGDLLRDRGHYRAAEVEYQRAREMDPYSPKILNKLGLCLFLGEEYERSLEPLQLGVKMYPSHSTTWVNLGRALFAADKKEESAKAFENALAINPFNPIPYRYLIDIYKERGEESEVERYFRDFKKIS